MTAIELRVRSIYDSLSTAEKKVADYFLNNVESVFSLPIAELAREADVSKVTWVRFCKAIGFDGLKDLKKMLFSQMHKMADQNASGPFSDVREIISTKMMIESIKQNSIQAIQDTAAMLDAASLEKAAATIVNASTVRIFGIGASGLVGADLHSKLMRINKHSYFSTDPHTQLTYAANMTSQDTAVLISMSGKTKEVLEILALARQRQTPTIALTRYSKTPLALNADTVLYVSAPEISKRSGAMSSRLAQLMAVDALFTATAHMDYDSIAVNLERSHESTSTHRIDGDEAYKFL